MDRAEWRANDDADPRGVHEEVEHHMQVNEQQLAQEGQAPTPPTGCYTFIVGVLGQPQLERQKCQGDEAQLVHRVGHRGRDRSLGRRGAEHFRSRGDNNRGIEQEPALPDQEGLENKEPADRDHGGIKLLPRQV